MKYNLYSIYDKVGQIYFPPFITANVETAMRDVKSAAENSQMGKFPMDYMLVHLGEWDNSNGEIMLSTLTQVATVESIIEE